MDRTEMFRRCAVFTAGVLVCAVGIAEDLMVPEDISNVIAFLASPMAHEGERQYHVRRRRHRRFAELGKSILRRKL